MCGDKGVKCVPTLAAAEAVSLQNNRPPVSEWQAVRSCRSPSSSLVTGRLKGSGRESSWPSHQPHPMNRLRDKRDTFSLPPFYPHPNSSVDVFQVRACPICSLWFTYFVFFFLFLWILQLSAAIQLPSGEDFHLCLHLLHPIVPEHSSFKILSTKVRVGWSLVAELKDYDPETSNHTGWQKTGRWSQIRAKTASKCNGCH